MLLAIVLGHSHFILAYFYKIMSRKIQLKNFLIFAGLSVGLFLYFYRISFPDFRLESLLLITTIYAIYHTIADDQFTLNFFSPNYTKIQKYQIFSLILALTALHLNWQFNFQYSWALLVSSFVFLLLIARDRDKSKTVWDNSDLFYLFQFVTVLVIYLSGVQFERSYLLVLSFIGIYHYLVYYFHYYSKIKSIELKTKSNLHKRSGYLAVVALSNALILFLFFFNQTAPNIYLSHFFSYNLFLILTLMHFISSTRTYEIPSLLGLKKN